MPSRVSRLFSSGSAAKKIQQLPSVSKSPPPRRTLILESPRPGRYLDFDQGFDQFDFGFDKLADTLSFPNPLLQDAYLSSEEEVSPLPLTTASTTKTWAIENVEEEEELDQGIIEEDEVRDGITDEPLTEEEEDDYRSVYDNDEDDDVSVYSEIEVIDNTGTNWQCLTAKSLALLDAGKPRLIDLPLRRSNSNVSNDDASRASSTSTTGTWYYGSEKASLPSTAASSVSDLSALSRASRRRIKQNMSLKQNHDVETKPWYFVQTLEVCGEGDSGATTPQSLLSRRGVVCAV